MFTLLVSFVPLASSFAVAADPLENVAPVPGLFTSGGRDASMFARGFDPLRGETRSPVLDFHYTGNHSNYNQWANPRAQALFKVPDEVYIYDVPAAELDSDSATFTNISGYAKYAYEYSYSAVVLLVVNAGHAAGSGYVQWALNNSQNMVGLKRHYTTSFKVDTYGPSVIRELMQEGGPQSKTAFAEELKLLPATRSSNADKLAYSDFVSKFGTHYVSSAVFGSMLDTYITLSKDVAVQIGVDVSADIEIALEFLLFIIGLQADLNGHTRAELNATFSESASATIAAYGGDVSLFARGNYSAWLDTVDLNPVPVNATYTSVTELVSDPVKKVNLQQHIIEYLAPVKAGILLRDAQTRSCAMPPGADAIFSSLPNPVSHSSSSLRVGAANDNDNNVWAQQSDGSPKTPLPSLSLARMGHGFDIRSGAVLSPLTTPLTYDDNQLFYDPISRDSYAVPDGLNMQALASVCVAGEYSLYLNVSMCVDAALDASAAALNLWLPSFITGLPFGADIFLAFLDVAAGLDAKFFVGGGGFFSIDFGFDVYELSQPVPSSSGAHRIDPQFAADIAALPAPSSKSPTADVVVDGTTAAAYRAVIDKYGSHYVSRETLGGYCNFTVSFDASWSANASISAEVLVSVFRCARISVVSSLFATFFYRSLSRLHRSTSTSKRLASSSR